MTRLVVERITFEFDDTWAIARWDDTRQYRDHIHRLHGELEGRAEGTKAVDLYGIRDGVPYLIELKDFRAFAIENKQRQLRELPLEIGLKARDSVAGIAGLCSRGNPPELAATWLRRIEIGEAARVLIWISEDGLRPGEARSTRADRHLVREDQIRRRLHWLTTKVLVGNPLSDPGVHGVAATAAPPR